MGKKSTKQRNLYKEALKNILSLLITGDVKILSIED